MMVQACCTSASFSEADPVMLIRMPRAPSIAPASSSGEAIARCAASMVRICPLAVAVPITAYPMRAMIVFTSAKSRLMMPGMVMMSEIPCTPCRRMSSATRKDSKNPAFSATASNFSFGITIVVSTDSISSAMPFSACVMRRFPSNENGLVTTATVSAPISQASEAMIGAAPVPVPPPRPVVTNTMSAPSSASIILSESSSAALRPTSGFAPAPSPLVSFTPSCSFTGACDMRSACRSVFAAMNSMPSTPASIMRLTALPPPPPTPITLILASLRASSLKLMRMLESVFIFFTWINFCCCLPLCPVRERGQGLEKSLSLLLTLPPRHETLVPNPYSLIAASRSFAYQKRLQPRSPAIFLQTARNSRSLSVVHHAQYRGELGLGQGGWHFGQRHGPGKAHGAAQHGLGDVEDAGQARSSAAQNDARDAHVEHAAVAQALAHHLE